ncbi:hypothetical protein JCM19239_5813 [Vibrio variabilis]|uniref:Uncharacterized protein n=1 Tax=Vibrio variabilis TaxID=990271 RepID=A0ABQ0J8D0_9VIBR|nr:hypothetical protein JCM19239_5813 [Vibrio variabilis]
MKKAKPFLVTAAIVLVVMAGVGLAKRNSKTAAKTLDKVGI